MRERWLPLLLLLGACGGGSARMDASTPHDAMLDANGDLSATLPTKLCTTTVCAASPCTTGCAFESPLVATDCASQVATTAVEACVRFCGLAPYGGGCYHHVDSPYCNSCGPYRDSCYVADYTDIDYANGGAICAATSGCSDGPSEDGGYIPMCDMSGPIDGGVDAS